MKKKKYHRTEPMGCPFVVPDTNFQRVVDTIHQQPNRKRMWPNCVLLALLLLVLLVFFSHSWIRFLLSPACMLLSMLLFFLLLGQIIRIFQYERWHRRAQAAARQGKLLPGSGRFFFRFYVLTSLFLLLCTLAAIFWESPDKPVLLLRYGALAAALLFCWLLTVSHQCRETARKTAIRPLSVACVLLAGTLWVVSCIGQNDSSPLTPDSASPPASSLLLNLEDMGQRTEKNQTYEARMASPFLEQITQGQYAAGAGPSLHYTVTRVRISLLYRLCKESLRKEPEQTVKESYTSISPDPWMAREAYACLPDLEGTPEEAFWRYLLCYENCLVELRLSWSPTTEQMAQIGEAFYRMALDNLDC